jgi:hypothetical protein
MSYTLEGKTGPWEIVCGLEVHAQVTSQAKLFSGAATAFAPTAVTADWGDGSPPQRCPLPLTGTTTSRPTCIRHTYLDTRTASGRATFTLTLTTHYLITLTTSLDPTPHQIDTIDGPATRIDLTTRELQAAIS